MSNSRSPQPSPPRQLRPDALPLALAASVGLLIVAAVVGLVITLHRMSTGSAAPGALALSSAGATLAAATTPAATSPAATTPAATTPATSTAPATTPARSTDGISPSPSHGVGGVSISAPAPTSAGTSTPTLPLSYLVRSGDNVTTVERYFRAGGYGELLQRFDSVLAANQPLVRPGQVITLSPAGLMFANGHG